ncbi:ribonuclease HI family protein [Methanolobus sediminis]|uniref:Ribonuclease HI family protein n=1 Tax=Methanolobus sediminis TaxID=3072978 RepID=A0AA51YHZ8_9EURY|nr:ribonuclease HI family protein [Methanolobus sediminis]WMW23980.1 ribonuclease HI family protein [Methanolobus sediminis]
MDAITFDGSCTPNPGGCMGLGWVVTLQNNSFSILGNDRLEKQTSNNALFAEYLALKKGMLEYVKADGQGPLTVMGDSQTVIYQMRGIYQIMDNDIWNIHRDITNIIREYELDIHFRWVPRMQNKQADRLSKTKQKVRIEYPNDREFLIDVRSSPAIGKLRKKIASMNATPFPTNAMYKRLHVSSKDLLSDKDLFELREMAGKRATRIAIETFPGKCDKNKYHQAQALRWMLRGLAIDLAIKKVKFDIQSKKVNGSRSAVKSKNSNSHTKKKTKSSGGAKYYLNRKTFAF